MNNVTSAFYSIVVFFAISPCVHGQTKKETIEFIVDKTGCTTDDRLDLHDLTAVQSVTIEKDTLTVTTKNTYTHLKTGVVRTTVDTSTVALKDLNPDRVSVEGQGNRWRVFLWTTEKKKVVTNKTDGKPRDDLPAIWMMTLDGDERSARRVAKAFSSLIKECGGKKDKFDD